MNTENNHPAFHQHSNSRADSAVFVSYCGQPRDGSHNHCNCDAINRGNTAGWHSHHQGDGSMHQHSITIHSQG